jgi:cholesterol oxidase
MPFPEGGYLVTMKGATGLIKKRTKLRARHVIFAGGVLGTVRLLAQPEKQIPAGT